MTQSFSFRRLWLLIRKQWLQNWKVYMMAMLVVELIFAISLFDDYATPLTNQKSIFLLLYTLVLPIFASLQFSAWGDKASAIQQMSLPATHFEKWLCAMFYVYIAFTIVFVAFFYAVDYPAATRLPLHSGYSKSSFGVLNVFERFEMSLIGKGTNFISALYYAPAIYLCGSIAFQKQAYFKTLAVVVLLFLLVAYAETAFNSLVFGGQSGEVQVNNLKISFVMGVEYFPELITPWVSFWKNLFKYGIVPLLWLVTYLKLREKEI